MHLQVYIEVTLNGRVFKGKVATVLISKRDKISLGLVVGVSVGVLLLVVIIFGMLFILWKRKYPAYTEIERGEDGAGKIFCFRNSCFTILGLKLTVFSDVYKMERKHVKMHFLFNNFAFMVAIK